MARSGKEKAIAPAPMDMDELLRKRDAFVTAMTLLRNAADEASRAGLVFFDLCIAPGTEQQQQQSHVFFQRGTTEEPQVPKKRAKRAKRDPAMPKRPMTAYLLFCHQGRDTVKADLGPDASHKEVLAELTKRWSDTPEDQKKAWQDLYQKNREVYTRDMALYKATKASESGEPSATGFTAVNTELDNPQESDAESDKAADEHGESEAEAEEDDAEEAEEAEEEEEEEEEEEIRSPTPPP
ncbi:HMG-box, partial [Tuber magnatum]